MEAHVERIEEQNVDFEALLVGASNYFCFSNCQNLLAEQGGARSHHIPGEQVRELNRSQPIASIHSSSSLFYSLLKWCDCHLLIWMIKKKMISLGWIFFFFSCIVLL